MLLYRRWTTTLHIIHRPIIPHSLALGNGWYRDSVAAHSPFKHHVAIADKWLGHENMDIQVVHPETGEVIRKIWSRRMTHDRIPTLG